MMDAGTVAVIQHTLADFDQSCRSCVSFRDGAFLTCCDYWPQVECKDVTVDDILFYVSENGCQGHQGGCLTLAKGFKPSSLCSCLAIKMQELAAAEGRKGGATA